jgi:outer membrane protein assembly factor BamB
MFRFLLVFVVLGPCFTPVSIAGDQPQWGKRGSRNLVSQEAGLPSAFDPETGENVKWSVELGTNTYTTPIVARGKVLIGTNNGNPRDPKHQGDRGVLMCFNESDGAFLWQLAIPKIADYQDWPGIGLTGVPTVEEDRVYLITNRCEVLCLDLEGLADGNDGPFTDEGRYLSPAGDPMKVEDWDGDILWVTDMIEELGTHPHDSPHGSILVNDRYLYLCTSNGVDAAHQFMPAPEAPSFAVFDKFTGKLVAVDGEGMGPRTVHCTWSSPSYGEVNGEGLICCGGGDGVCYAFEPVDPENLGEEVSLLKRVWRFDCDPEGPKENVHSYKGNLKTSASNITGMPVFVEGKVFVEAGGDLWHGKKEAWLKCIDASQRGTITQSGLVWTYPLDRHCMSTPAVTDDFVFIGDCGRTVHCIDRKTGEGLWIHDAEGEIWGSPLVADGKVYIGTRRGHLWVFAAEKGKKVLSRIDFKEPIQGTPTGANAVLFVASMSRLFAIAQVSHSGEGKTSR